MKLKKVNILPLILITFIVMFLIFIGGLIYLMNMVTYVNETKNKSYDEVCNNLASIVKQDIESTLISFNSYADLLSKSASLKDIQKVKPIFELANQTNRFENLGIVFLDGEGFDMSGNAINVKDREYFNTAINGKAIISSQLLDYYSDHLIIVYAAPIMQNNQCKAVLIGKINAQMRIDLLGEDLVGSNDRMLILDQKNQVISYTKDRDINFNYNQINQDGYLFTPMENFNPSPTRIPSFTDTSFENTIKTFQQLFTDKTNYVWYSKPIGINNWNVLIGRLDVIDSQTKQILILSSQSWLIISIAAFLLLTIMLILQGRSNKQLSKVAYIDHVTGASNWNRFENQATRLLNKRKSKNYAMVVLDVSKFKIINDLYGHHKGDVLLKQISNEIRKMTYPGEIYTRHMADKFDLLLFYSSKDVLITRIQTLFNQIDKISEIQHLRFSVGIYVITNSSLSIQRLSDYATIAKDSIKESHENSISFFEEQERDRLLTEKSIENDMEDALKNREFHVYLQPKYHVTTKNIIGAEALVRWISPKRGFISPGEFIPTFEKNGFIIHLDRYMIEHVCILQQKWMQKGLPLVPISVNISRLHFNVPTIVQDICAIVDYYQVPHQFIELELTESAFFDNKNALLSAVNLFREMGFLVSMDDFGSGFSSLNALKDLPLDVVKLDREFFTETTNTERGKTVVRDTIHMAKNLEMSVVAEGIETEEQVAFLAQTACDSVQGFYFSKPLPISDFETLHYPNA